MSKEYYSRDNVELTINETNDNTTVSVTLIDSHGHFENELELNNNQAYDLMKLLDEIKNKLKSTD